MKSNRLTLFCASIVLGSCSFNSNYDYNTHVFHHVDSRNVKRADFDLAKKYDKACVTIKGVGVDGSAWTEVTKDNASNPTTLSVQFKMPDLLGGYTYTISAFAVDIDNANLDGTATQSPCPAELPSKAGWAQLGKTTIKAPEKLDGTLDIQIPFVFYEPVASAALSLYDDAAAMALGQAAGPGGVEMEYVSANNGVNNFKIWKEKGGQGRILNATGLVANGWQKTLERRGDAFTNTDLQVSTVIAGRACPRNVFLNHSNMKAEGRCLYYDSNTGIHLLGSGIGTPNIDYILAWSDTSSGPFGDGAKSSYYEGNFRLCADNGMRLPTLYETQTQGPTTQTQIDYLPDGDGITPNWPGNDGVPALQNDWTWTASANRINSGHFWKWNNFLVEGQDSGNSNDIRCVLPSH